MGYLNAVNQPLDKSAGQRTVGLDLCGVLFQRPVLLNLRIYRSQAVLQLLHFHGEVGNAAFVLLLVIEVFILGKNTFNISTCACFVVAGAGYKVAKHGNYGATSVSGASNVIEQHGVRFTNNPDTLKRSMEECNIAYLHAQLFNPAMKFVGPVRKTLGVRTLFNLLGPLVNPCCPAYQLLGVADLSQMRLYTNVFYKLGIDFAVVNSLDSYDEISLTDEFKVMTRNYERIYRPQALGFKDARPEELFGGVCKEDAARIFDNILTGHATPAQTQCVIVNAAFAIQVMEPQKEIEECIAIARESLDSGRALATLKKFIEINK